MKAKIIFIISMMFFFSLLLKGIVGEVSAQTVVVDSIIQTSPCAGSNIYIPYSVSGGNFNFGNVFTAQLSDNTGSFSNPTNIGSLPYWSSGVIVGTIPFTASFGIFYKVRIVASTPAYSSSPAPNNVIVTTIAQIATLTVSPNDTICIEDSVTLSVITPAQDYVWSTGESTQSINVSQSGSFTVTVTDMLGCKTVSEPEIITVQVCLSVRNVFSEDVINIYPNPISENFILQIINGQIAEYKFVMYDMLGSEVLQTEIQNPKSEIQRGNISSGMFFYKIADQKGIVQTGKIIVE